MSFMKDQCFLQSRARHVLGGCTLLPLLLCGGLAARPAQAACTAETTKTCPPSAVCTGKNVSFTLNSAQTIEWRADRGDPATGSGDDFILLRPDGAEIVVTTSLGPGLTSGSYFLSAGTYQIFVAGGDRAFRVGPGTYSVVYDRSVAINLMPPDLSFGTIAFRGTSPQIVTLSWPSQCSLSVTGVKPSDPRFTVSGVPFMIPAGGSVTLTVTFSAQLPAGDVVATLTATGATTTSSPPVPAGTAILRATIPRTAAFEVSIASLPFPTRCILQTYSRTMTVSATGTEPVTVTATSTNPARFTVSPPSVTVSPCKVPPCPSKALTVTFHAGPDPVGTVTGTLELVGTSGALSAGMATVALSGSVSGSVSICPPDIECGPPDSPPYLGNFIIGRFHDHVLYFKNVGTGTLGIANIRLEPTDPLVFEVDGPPPVAPLAPMEIRAVPIHFYSAFPGFFPGNMVVESNDPDESPKLCPFSIEAFNPPGRPPPPSGLDIPTLSAWGRILMTLALLATGTWMLVRRGG